MGSFIIDLSILFLVIVFISFIIKIIKQPIILGYILSGIIFSLTFAREGPFKEYVLTLSELGITFLLFLIGLEFDFKSFKGVGKDILITTFVESLIFFLIAFFFSKLFGFSTINSIYLSTFFMFSSTLLVAKWIEDKKDTHVLYGKVVLGTLVVQDLLAIIFFTFLNISSFTGFSRVLFLPIGGIILLLSAYVSSRYLLNPLIKFTLKYPELMFIFSLGVCFFFVKISSLLGYTPAIGAFIGGLVLANTIYKNDIFSRLKPLIIFFSMLFFVGLGFQLELSIPFNLLLFILGLSLFGLLVKPLAIYLILRVRGYDIKTSIRSGLNLAQFSEFGIIIILTGISSKLALSELGTIAILSVVVTMLISSYIIKYDAVITNIIYGYLIKFNSIFPEKKLVSEKISLDEYDLVFMGYSSLNKDILSKFQNFKRIMVIENDPSNIAILKKEGIPYIYNSIANPYFFENLNLKSVSLLVSNLTDVGDNLMILKKLKNDNQQSHFIVTAKSLKDSLTLYEAGADYVLYLRDISENHLALLIEDYSKDINKLIERKLKDIERFKQKQDINKETEKVQFLSWSTFLKKILKKDEKILRNDGLESGTDKTIPK